MARCSNTVTEAELPGTPTNRERPQARPSRKAKRCEGQGVAGRGESSEDDPSPRFDRAEDRGDRRGLNLSPDERRPAGDKYGERPRAGQRTLKGYANQLRMRFIVPRTG